MAVAAVLGNDVAAAQGPRAVYAQRLALRQEEAKQLDQRLDRLGQGRVATFSVALVLALTAHIGSWPLLYWGLPPLGLLFLFLSFRYDAISRRLARARRAERFYVAGLDRLEGRWTGIGDDGQCYLDEEHLYALDLDVFGHGSLFQRLSTARTRRGADTLAAWLKAPAGVEEVRARQEAVAELRPRLDLRERLALLGSELPPADLAPLAAWGAAPPALDVRRVRLLVNVLAALNVVTLLIGFEFTVGWLPFLGSVLLSIILTGRLKRDVVRVLAPVEMVERDLGLLAGLLAVFEREPFTAPELKRVQAALLVEGLSPSRQVARLATLAEWLRAQGNQFFLPIAALFLWRTRMAAAIESWRMTSGPAIGNWLAAIGEVEALAALAAYAYENPADPFPEVIDGPAQYDGEGLGHPLLPADRCVRNDVQLGPSPLPLSPTRGERGRGEGGVRLLMVSGSNMSGKSTLLRTVGVNAVLALAGAPVRAQRLRLTPLALGATLRVQDSLLEGRSRFFAEVRRVRKLMDVTQGPLPLLFLLDELFHGTNSHDRGVGAEAVLRHLLERGALGLVTTHDLALTCITEQLGTEVRNVHFVDEFKEGEMHFDYRLRDGVVPHSNALALMRAVGLEV